MSLLCRIGLHSWELKTLVTAEDLVALHFDGEVCRRCGKIGDRELAVEAFAMMRANFRTKNVRFIVHPSLGINATTNHAD